MSGASDPSFQLTATSQGCSSLLARELDGMEDGLSALERGDSVPFQDPSPGAQDTPLTEEMDVPVCLDDDRFDILDGELRLKIGEGRLFQEAFFVFVTAQAELPGEPPHAELIALTALDLDWLSQEDETWETLIDRGEHNLGIEVRARPTSEIVIEGPQSTNLPGRSEINITPETRPAGPDVHKDAWSFSMQATETSAPGLISAKTLSLGGTDRSNEIEITVSAKGVLEPETPKP